MVRRFCSLQVWDALNFTVVAVLSLAVFAAYNDRATVGSAEQAMGTFLLLLCYGISVIPLTYCYSFGFKSASAAQARPRLLLLITPTSLCISCAVRMLVWIVLPMQSFSKH